MKTYEAVFNEIDTEGVYGISLVHNPAMKGTFVALNEQQEMTFKTVDEDKRILIGLVLEPNKPVYRNQNGEEFNIVFSEDTIRNLSYNFFKRGHQQNSTIEHVNRIEGVTFVESWLVEDSNKDKSNAFGFIYPKGSWIATMKIDNEDIWQNFVKSGKVKGFSVDAMLGLKEINLKSDEMSNKILETLREINLRLKGEKPKDVQIKMAMVKTADGAVTLEYEGEELRADIRVFAISEDDERVPLPVGEYPIEGDMIIVVEQEGFIKEVKSAQMQETEVAAEMNTEASAADANPLKDLAEIKSILIKYQEENKAYQAKNDAAINELKENLVTLSEQPAAKPIKSQPQAVELNAKGRLLQKLRG